jgi:hypothetical protein
MKIIKDKIEISELKEMAKRIIDIVNKLIVK